MQLYTIDSTVYTEMCINIQKMGSIQFIGIKDLNNKFH